MTQQTETTSPYAGIVIYLAESTASELFEGCDLDQTDADASAARYYELLTAAVEAHYPGAEVQTSRHPSYANIVDAPLTMADLGDHVYTELFRPEGDPPLWTLSLIHDDIWERGDFWVES